MKKVFAILHEPASYTLKRNEEAYGPIGVDYCYINSSSKASQNNIKKDSVLSSFPFFSLAKYMKRVLKENDIIIMNGYTNRYFLLLFILNFFYRRPIGIDSDTPLNIPPNKIKRLIKEFYLGCIFRNKHIYGLAGGTGSHKDLFRHYGMKEDRIFLMPMISILAEDKEDKIELINKDSSWFRFLYVGRIVDVKNIEIMIKAFIKDFNNSKDIELRIVGEGELRESLSEKYSNYKNIIFTGPKFGKELISEYREASAFILPSRFEPWGLVVNEAMSFRLPVIVSDQVGAGFDLVENNGTGYIFQYDDIEDLGEKMSELVMDKKLYQEMSNNAYNLIHNYWNYDLYRKCLNDFIEKAE